MFFFLPMILHLRGYFSSSPGVSCCVFSMLSVISIFLRIYAASDSGLPLPIFSCRACLSSCTHFGIISLPAWCVISWTLLCVLYCTAGISCNIFAVSRLLSLWLGLISLSTCFPIVLIFRSCSLSSFAFFFWVVPQITSALHRASVKDMFYVTDLRGLRASVEVGAPNVSGPLRSKVVDAFPIHIEFAVVAVLLGHGAVIAFVYLRRILVDCCSGMCGLPSRSRTLDYPRHESLDCCSGVCGLPSSISSTGLLLGWIILAVGVFCLLSLGVGNLSCLS